MLSVTATVGGKMKPNYPPPLLKPPLVLILVRKSFIYFVVYREFMDLQ